MSKNGSAFQYTEVGRRPIPPKKEIEPNNLLCSWISRAAKSAADEKAKQGIYMSCDFVDRSLYFYWVEGVAGDANPGFWLSFCKLLG